MGSDTRMQPWLKERLASLKRFLAGVVQVDVVFVREKEFHFAEGVAGPGFLPHANIVAAAGHLHVMPPQVRAAAFADAGQHFF